MLTRGLTSVLSGARLVYRPHSHPAPVLWLLPRQARGAVEVEAGQPTLLAPPRPGPPFKAVTLRGS